MYFSPDTGGPCPRRPPSSPRHCVTSLYRCGSSGINEDVVLQDSGLYGVFDGATSLGRYRDAHNRTGGQLAAQIAAYTFASSPLELKAAAKQANSAIMTAQISAGTDMSERHLLWSTSAAVVRLNGHAMEYCATGDALILLLGEDGHIRLLTPDPGIDTETLRLWQCLEPTPEPIHSRLAEQIRAVRLRMNVDYGVLNGEPDAMRFLQHGCIETTGLSDILVFTDGLVPPRSDPRQPVDWREFVAHYRKGGLPAILAHTRMLQDQDPDCRRFPRFKHRDDIAAVAVTLLSAEH